MSNGSTVTLFLDDESRLIQSFRQRLDARGCAARAAFATSVEEADQLLAAYPDITQLIADWKMPGLDGISYLQDKRRVYPRLTLVLLTGFIGDLQDDEKEILRSINAIVVDKGVLFQ